MKTMLMIVLMTIVGCSVNPSKVSKNYAKKFVESMTFVKHSNGLCFGIVASRKTGQTDSTGIAITEVTCSDVGL